MVTIREILTRTYRDLAASAAPDDRPRQEALDVLARTIARCDPHGRIAVSDVERTIEDRERGQ